MPTKNNKKRVFDRNVVHEHKREEKRDKEKEHSPYIPIFFGIGLAAVVCSMLFVGIGVASATGYYVSLSGDDADYGTTLDTAWRHIDYAVNHISAGDIIYVVPGNYGAEHVTITTSGTALNPIKITRYGTSGIITLKHDIGSTGIGIRVYGNYWIIEHFDVLNYEMDLFIDGDYNTINFVEAHGESDYGFTVAPGGDYNVFKECVAHDLPKYPESIGFKISGDYNLVKDCKAYNLGHFGIAISRTGGGPFGNVVDGGEYWNMYSDTAIAAGGTATGGATDTIFKNIFVHDTNNGIRTYFGTVNTTIENCTITNMRTRDGIAMYGSGTVRNNKIRNWTLFGIWGSGSDITCSENDMQDSSRPEYMFTTEYTPDYIGVIKNQKGSSFTINIPKYAGAAEPPTAVKIEYTDGRTFSANGVGEYTTYTINSIGTYNIEVIGGVSTGTISGTVKDKDTGNPIQGATVTADSYSDITNTTGGYTITLPVGTYTVTASKTDYQSQSQENVVVLEGLTTPVNFQLTETSGLLISNLNRYTAKTDFDNGVVVFSDRKYTVSLVPEGYRGLDWIQTQCSDKQSTGSDWLTFDVSKDVTVYVGYAESLIVDGYPEAPWLDDGTWLDTNEGFEIVGYEPGYEPMRFLAKTFKKGGVTLGGNYGDPIPPMYVVLVARGEPSTGTISGIVTDKDTGTPIGGATVSANSHSDTTNSTGGYTIILPVGNYTVTATKTGYQSQSQENVQVLEDQTTTVNFLLTLAPDDLIGFWRFEEGSGTTAVDSSGQGNDGTLTNMDPATDWVDGKVGDYALSFDGTDDYVDCGTSASLIFNDSDPWSFEHWINWAGQQDKLNVIYAGLGSGVREYFVIKNNGNNRFAFRDKDTNYHHFALDSSSPYINKWTHLTWIADGNGNLTLYINGEYYNTLSSVPTQMHFYRIGRSYYCNDYNFKGTIDEVTIYNRALSAEEILADYEAGVNSTYPRYDVNEDGKVDISDTTIVGQHFGETTNPPYPRYDVNEDGMVGILDTTIVGQHFGEITSQKRNSYSNTINSTGGFR